jgi:hypothetical protein
VLPLPGWLCIQTQHYVLSAYNDLKKTNNTARNLGSAWHHSDCVVISKQQGNVVVVRGMMAEGHISGQLKANK